MDDLNFCQLLVLKLLEWPFLLTAGVAVILANKTSVPLSAQAMVDSSGLCLFTTGTWGYEDFSKMIDADFPGKWDAERLRQTGERIWNLEKLFNLKAGLAIKDDTLPPRMLKDPVPAGFNKGGVAELGVMLPQYYAACGWSEQGIPSKEKLDSLNIVG